MKTDDWQMEWSVKITITAFLLFIIISFMPLATICHNACAFMVGVGFGVWSLATQYYMNRMRMT